LTGGGRRRIRYGVAALVLVAHGALFVGCGGGDHAAERDEAVRRAEQVAGAARAAGPLPGGAFRAAISVAAPPHGLRAGQRETVRVKVKNLGDADWPAHGRDGDGYFQVNLGYTWRDAGGRAVEDVNYVWSSFPADVKPGEEVELPLNITAPRTPGEYVLELDLVQEMVAWFRDKGSESFKTKVRVE
jgi:hypothetical protein